MQISHSNHNLSHKSFVLPISEWKICILYSTCIHYVKLQKYLKLRARYKIRKLSLSSSDIFPIYLRALGGNVCVYKCYWNQSCIYILQYMSAFGIFDNIQHCSRKLLSYRHAHLHKPVCKKAGATEILTFYNYFNKSQNITNLWLVQISVALAFWQTGVLKQVCKSAS